MSRRTLAGLITVFVVCACAAPAAVPAPEPVVARPAPVALDPLRAPWTPDLTNASVRQELRLEASLLSRIDTAERRDTLRSALAVEWSRVNGEGAPRTSGLVTAFGISADTSAPAALPGLRMPIPFTVLNAVGTVAPRLTRPEPGSCGLDAAATSGVRELLITLPPRLEPGTAWTDSARYTICRDSVSLTVESVREFRVAGAERRASGVVVLIERRSHTTMHGEGRQFGEAITIDATGEGSAQLAVRLAGAFVERGEGESLLRMTMRGRRRSQELTQHTRLEIVTP